MAKPNNERGILLALQAIQNDPKLSIRQATAIYNVSRNIFQTRKFGVSFRRDITPNCRILTILEEKVIIKHVFGLYARAFPPRIADVEVMANSLRATRHAPPVGSRWASRFVARRLELKIRWNRPYDYQRA
jgi:hypothetical protein